MKFVHSEINHVFDTKTGKVPTLVIENPGLLYRLLVDIRGQLAGINGKCVVSNEGKILNFEKSAELLTEYVPFTINRKNLLNKASASLERSVMEGDLYVEAMELLHHVESFLLKASFDFNGDIIFSKMNFASLVKASGLEFREEYESLPEKVIDYMELVAEFEGEKLFILYNLRSLISDQETELFLDTALRREYNILMLESSEHSRLSNEQRYIVDDSLCEIC